ncbi:TPA: Panacea domain-containing protein [Vibrio cholerae]
MYRAIDIANWFINQFDKESGDVVTHLKIQKLLYYAEAWTQLLLDKNLFKEDIEAWAHGPVVREVFNEFRDYGWEPLTMTDALTEIDAEVEDVLLQVMSAYGEASAKTLENMTHKDKPWIDARGSLAPEARCNNVIPKPSIKAYFSEKYGNQLNG